jgi:hypothetical protein
MKASLILAAVGAAALMFPNLARGFFDRLDRAARKFANARWAILWIGVLVFGFSIALTIFFRLPQPRIHDEFSYLLQSDTLPTVVWPTRLIPCGDISKRFTFCSVRTTSQNISPARDYFWRSVKSYGVRLLEFGFPHRSRSALYFGCCALCLHQHGHWPAPRSRF